MMMLKIPQRPVGMTLTGDLRKVEKFVQETQARGCQEQLMTDSKLEEFGKDTRVWDLYDMGQESKLLMPQDSDFTLDYKSPEKVIVIESNFRDTASALPSSNGLRARASTRRTQGMSSMKSTTDMSEIWMASSTEVTVQSLSDGKILHYREGTNHDFLDFKIW